MVDVRVSLKLEASWDFFFAKDRTAPEAYRFYSFLRILEMQFDSKKKDKNKKKSHKSLFESLSKNTWKYMELKYLDLEKKTGVVSSWSRSHSPIESLADR